MGFPFEDSGESSFCFTAPGGWPQAFCGKFTNGRTPQSDCFCAMLLQGSMPDIF